MKILFVIDIPWFSGVTSYAVEAARGLAGRGHEIVFAGVKGGAPLELALGMGFKTAHVPGRKNPLVFQSVFSLKKIIEAEKIDLVNALTGSSHFAAYAASLVTAKKFTLIRTKADVLPPKKSFLYGKTGKLIVASNMIKEQYIKIGVEPAKITTVYQGIESPGIYPERALPVPPVMGMVGRLDPVKGHKNFIEAAAIVLKKYPDVKFKIAGREENIKYADLEKAAAEKGVSGSVRFCGYVENIPDFMGRCSLGVICSSGSEAVSRVLLEWMAAGRAVVSTGVGCIPEILPEIFIVPPENPEAMAEKISALLADKSSMESAAAENKRIVEERFSFKKFIDGTEKAYAEALGSR